MPIFMIGTQRSGSNLLRLMLNQLQDIAAPHPPHILQRMMPLIPGYGDLAKDSVFATLVDDVCRLVELNPVPWEGVTLNRKNVVARCQDHSLVAVFGAVYDIAAEVQNARAWCCKSLANIYYIPEIERYFGEKAKYIYLYRDGRDVAVSFRKAVVGEKHFYHIAKEWTEAQDIALNLRRKVAPDRFFSLSYEELIGQTEKTIRSLCRFLGVEYKDSMLDFHRSEEAKRTASSSELWGNVVNPIMTSNSRKFLKEATESDISIFESVAGNVLDQLGYKRVLIQKGQELRFAPEEVKRLDSENKKLKEEALKKVDADDLKRRQRQENLLKEIKARAPGIAAKAR